MANIKIPKLKYSSFYVLIKDINRGQIFYEKTDYDVFLAATKKFHDKYGCELHAYALLSDHVNLLITVSEFVKIARIINLIQHQFSEYFNIRYRRTFRILDLQFSIELINPATRILNYYRYVELAPVRTKIVEHPSDYPWSSYGCNAMGEDSGMISAHPEFKSLGEDNQARWKIYREMFDQKKTISLLS